MEIEDNISASGSWLLSVWGSFCPVVSNTWPSSPKMFALLHAYGSLLHQCQSSCLVLLGKDSRSPLSITRTTYFVSFEPVCHVSLNTIIEALLFGWHKRGLFFSMWFECFVCISKSEPFCLFFSVRTFEEWNLPTRENCSDALRRMWITFWKRCWKFCREIAGGKDKLQNSGDKKHSSWGRNFYLYNLERDKNPWNVPRDNRHISDCSSIKLWFSPRSRRYFSMFLMHLRCEKGKQSVVTQCSDENIDMKNEDLFYPQCSVYQQPFISSPMECGGDNSQLCVTRGLCTTSSELQVGIMALCARQKGKQDFPNAYQWAAISSLPNGHILPGAIFFVVPNS